MLRSNVDGTLLSRHDLRRERNAVGLHDITAHFNDLLIPRKLPRGWHDFKQVGIVGRPGTGKTVLMASIASLAVERHGDAVNIAYADALPLAVERMDARPFQLLLVDDASGQASGRRSMSRENVETTQDLNTLRHKLKNLQLRENADYMGGLVVVIMAWQREKDLEKSLRQADFRIWKTPPMEWEDRAQLEKQIGAQATKTLNSISYRILHGNNTVKALSVASVMSIGLEAGGVGLYTMPMTDYQLPPLVRQEDVDREKEEQAAVALAELAEQAEKEKDATRAHVRADLEVVRILKAEGLSNRDIAVRLGVSHSTINRRVKELNAAEGVEHVA